jgi:hypothetical protein
LNDISVDRQFSRLRVIHSTAEKWIVQTMNSSLRSDLAPAGSALGVNAELVRDGIRVGVSGKSAYDFF